MSEGASPPGSTDRSVTLTAAGITLLGVLLSIGVTVGLGIDGALWLRLLLGGACTVLLITVVKVASRSGHGLLARLANWTINAPSDR